MGAGSRSAVAAGLAGLALATVAAVTLAAPRAARTQITVWSAPQPTVDELFGGLAYGGRVPTTGALITEQREIEVGAGDVRLTGVAATLDPASVQVRDRVRVPGSGRQIVTYTAIYTW